MAVTTFTLPYVGTPPYFSGTAASSLVPNIFPIAIDGRPYMVDQKSGLFQRNYEQRVRDSQDISTAPGEAAINPGGLWRRGQDSWHVGAGQQYADTAESKDYRFYKSQGINPWVKGQLSLLNATKRSLESTNTNLYTCVVKNGGTEYLYVADGNTVKFSSNPYATTPTWTSVTGGSVPTTTITGLETNGVNVFIAFTGDDIWYTTPGSTSASFFYPTSGTTGKTYTAFSYAKGYGFAAVGPDLYAITPGSGSHAIYYENPDASFNWVGAAAGKNAVYAAGYAGAKSIIYRCVLKTTSAGLDIPVAALELPVGEVVASIYGYLGYILLGTNKGVRYCTVDDSGDLIAGPIIPTNGTVYSFTAEDKYVWFTWSNYENTTGGLGRLDLSVFSQTNTPAYATDLMYTSTANVVQCETISSKRIFAIAGVGIIVEDSANLVASGSLETGIWRWGIPDRKFVAKIDTRATPLVGSISQYMSLDNGAYELLGTWATGNDTENTVDGSDNHAIEAAFKFELKRDATNTSTGPTLTRWMARSYVSPFRSQEFIIPIILHRTVVVRDKEYYYDVEEHQSFFDSLIESPRIVTLQIGNFTHTVIVDDVKWAANDAHGNAWVFEGTLVVTLRSVEN